MLVCYYGALQNGVCKFVMIIRKVNVSLSVLKGEFNAFLLVVVLL